MTWSRVPTLSVTMALSRPQASSYLSYGGEYRVSPVFARGRGGRRLKSTAWELTAGGRYIASFQTAKLAKLFAEALDELADDRRARRDFIRSGGQWTYWLDHHLRNPDWFPDPRVYADPDAELDRRIAERRAQREAEKEQS